MHVTFYDRTCNMYVFTWSVYFQSGVRDWDQASAERPWDRILAKIVFLRENDENAKSCRPILPGWKIIDYKRSLENTI